jgi:hypothetical protein
MSANPYPEERKWYEMPKSAKRALGDDPAPAPSHTRRHVPANYRDVRGWGADLDPANRPMFPKELPSDVTTARGEVKDWQTSSMKVHMSVEHPNLTPVFGTSCPPKGLSGLLRDYAYQFGEGSNRHWMTLVLADRVDMIECMVADPFRGRGDNYIAEKGWSANWKYASGAQRRRYASIAAAAVGGIAVAMLLRKVLRD